MMKKLLLLAILSPLALQTEMKAAAAEAGVLTKILQPWSEAANAPWRSARNYSFNLKLDVFTALLSVGAFAYKFGLEEPLRGSYGRTNGFISDWLPKILAGHELYKRSTTLVWNRAPHDPMGYLISVAKIFLCLSDKLATRDFRNAFARRINLAMPAA